MPPRPTSEQPTERRRGATLIRLLPIAGSSVLAFCVLAAHLYRVPQFPVSSPLAFVVIAASVAVAVAVARGHMQPGSILRTFASPLRTLARFRGVAALAVGVVVMAAAAVAAHPLWGPWPGMVASAIAAGTLVALLQVPRSLYKDMGRLLDAPDAAGADALLAVAHFLRRLDRHDTIAATDGSRADDFTRALRVLDETDCAHREELNFDAAGWLVVWLCMLLALHAGTVMRALSLVDPDLFAQQATPGAGAWPWLIYAVETFIVRGELGFNVYDFYELDGPTWLGCQRIVEGIKLKPLTILLQSGIGVALAAALFSRFTFLRRTEDLLHLAAVTRYASRMDHAAYRALRALRPVIETAVSRRLLRALHVRRMLRAQKEWPERRGLPLRAWRRLTAAADQARGLSLEHGARLETELTCMVSLLRSPRFGPLLAGVVNDETMHVQVRITALASLVALGRDDRCAHVSWTSWNRLLDALEVDLAAPSAEDQLRERAWTGRHDGVGRADVFQAWCDDVLTVARAPAAGLALADVPATGPAPAGTSADIRVALARDWRTELPIIEASGSLQHVLVAAARHDRVDALRELLVALPWCPRAIAAAFETHFGALASKPSLQDQALFEHLVLARSSSRACRHAALAWFTPEHLAPIWRPHACRALLQLAWTEVDRPNRFQSCLVLSRICDGPAIGALLLDTWQHELDAVRWHQLLEAIVVAAPGDVVVSRGLALALHASTWLADAPERVRLRRALCLQAPPEILELELGLPTQATSIGVVLRYVPGASVTVGGVRHDVEPLWVADHPVTKHAWMQYAAGSGRCMDGPEDGTQLRVSWHDAAAFCEWLTRREHALGRIGMQTIYRLPTEVEWQRFAATDEDRCGSPPLVQVRPARTGPMRRGEDEPNGWGLFSLAGNVWEWCANSPSASPLHSHSSLTAPGSRAVRGGSWSAPLSAIHATTRAAWHSSARADHIGFRIVLGSAVPFVDPGIRNGLDPYLLAPCG